MQLTETQVNYAFGDEDCKLILYFPETQVIIKRQNMCYMHLKDRNMDKMGDTNCRFLSMILYITDNILYLLRDKDNIHMQRQRLYKLEILFKANLHYVQHMDQMISSQEAVPEVEEWNSAYHVVKILNL